MGRVRQVTARYLVDSRILLWALNNDRRLSEKHRSIFVKGEDVVISAVSILEIAIKRSLGKVTLAVELVPLLRQRGIPILALNEKHAARVEHLPFHHRDPFDRALIAQAQVEGLTLATTDANILRYDVLLA